MITHSDFVRELADYLKSDIAYQTMITPISD